MKKICTPFEPGQPDIAALENAPAKSYFRFFFLFFFVCGPLFFTACEEKEGVNPDDQQLEDVDEDLDIDADSIDIDFENSIGLVVDTRPIFKKGYKPTEIKISFEGDFAIYSQTLPIDQFTNLAILRINSDILTEDEIKQFQAGIPIHIYAFDDQNTSITTITEAKAKIDDSNEPFAVDTDLPKRLPPFALNNSISYYVQPVNYEGVSAENTIILKAKKLNDYAEDYAYFGAYNPNENVITGEEDSYYTGQNFAYYFEPVEEGNDSTFFIREKYSNRYLKVGPHAFPSLYCPQPPDTHLIRSNKTSTPNDPSYEFVIRQEGEWITIRPLYGAVLRYAPVTYCSNPYFPKNILSEVGSGDVIKFKLVSADIKWTVEDQGTRYNNPILPKANISFAFKEYLENCSNAIVTGTVGKQDTRISSFTVSSEEAFQLATSMETTESENSTYSSNLNIAGVDIGGASYEMSTSLSYGRDSTSTSTKGFSETGQKEVQVSRVRTIEIPPHTAVEVSDVIISLNQIWIPFVQRLRISGTFEGTKLTGEEVATQLIARPFDGVITEIGADFIMTTVKGYVFVEEAMEAQTIVKELKDVCE